MVIKPKEGTPNTYKFSTVSQSEINTWKWSFGDGSTSERKDPEHIYTKAGIYEVSCAITTAVGCTETRTSKLNVLAAPLPDCSGAISIILFDPTDNQCNGKAIVKLLDKNGVEIANVKYHWSDGKTGSTIEGLCQDKPYSVQAGIEGVCQKSYSFTFLSKPVWRASTIDGQNKFAVVEPKDGIEYEWDFGNGTILKGAEVTYDFPTDGVYEVKLKAASGLDFSELSQQVVVMNSVTGTTIINKSEIGIYPNPAKEMLKINFGNPLEGNIYLEILNLTGRRVSTQQMKTSGTSQIELSVNQLKKGIYFLRISSGNILITNSKFIKAE
jgi:PKD repeat protein